jgi:hypothetical protein
MPDRPYDRCMVKISLLSLLLAATSALASEADSCDDLGINESRRISTPYAKTGIPAFYTVRRSAENEHEVYFNPNFYDRDFQTDSYTDYNPEFRPKVKECFDKHNRTLVDEKGRRLKLVLYEKDLHAHLFSEVPPVQSITIREKGFRSRSTQYARNINCVGIVHELLHMTGLVDEYQEGNFFGLGDKFPSRPKSDSSSWMAEESRGFLDTGLFKTKKKLYSGQLNVILYPECETKNATYYSCARFAYVKGKVEDQPEICKKKNVWLLDQP